MKITVGRLVDDEVVSTYRVKIWTASHWTLNNQTLSQVLNDKAFEAAGITPGPYYTAATQMWGGSYVKDKTSDKDWTFEVNITRRKWVEVTE